MSARQLPAVAGLRPRPHGPALRRHRPHAPAILSARDRAPTAKEGDKMSWTDTIEGRWRATTARRRGSSRWSTRTS
jgi:hypothetical protein